MTTTPEEPLSDGDMRTVPGSDTKPLPVVDGDADGTDGDSTDADGTDADGTDSDSTDADGTDADGTDADGTDGAAL
jgi:hypothetical protein